MISEDSSVEVVDLVKTYRGTRLPRSSLEFRKYFGALRGLHDGNNAITALDGVSFAVSRGEVFGLLGPNGAGKTTLIKILSTLVLPDSGQALVNGIDVVKRPRVVSKYLQSVLAEGFGFERRLSGRQNLEFYGDLYGIPPAVAKRRIIELLSFAGLGEVGELMFQKYSTGMARKLLVCRALLSNAPVLVFDEPTSGLDPVSAVEFRMLLKEVLARKMGKTIILATHNLSEAQQICDRIAVLRKGRVAAIGTPSQIRQNVGDNVSMSFQISAIREHSKEEFSAKASGIAGLTSLDVSENGQAGSFNVSIGGTRDFNYNELFELFGGLGLKVISVEATQPSLEDAFVKITSEDGA